jgi:hypothetical protein
MSFWQISLFAHTSFLRNMTHPTPLSPDYLELAESERNSEDHGFLEKHEDLYPPTIESWFSSRAKLLIIILLATNALIGALLLLKMQLDFSNSKTDHLAPLERQFAPNESFMSTEKETDIFWHDLVAYPIGLHSPQGIESGQSKWGVPSMFVIRSHSRPRSSYPLQVPSTSLPPCLKKHNTLRQRRCSSWGQNWRCRTLATLFRLYKTGIKRNRPSFVCVDFGFLCPTSDK